MNFEHFIFFSFVDQKVASEIPLKPKDAMQDQRNSNVISKN